MHQKLSASKRSLIALSGFLFSTTLCFSTIARGQEAIEYNLCNQDFRALNNREGLPANAVYTNIKATAEARAKDVISRLTFEEKLTLTGGWKRMHFPAVQRLGLPPVAFADASQGLRIQKDCIKMEKSTAFPATIALAATWNTELAYEYAKSIGEEYRGWGVSVLLGPGMNMYRNATGGRNYEYLGEDPFLTSAMSVNYIKGLQQTGTMATIKHFIGNEQELARHVANIKIGERALREIYLPPFVAGIKEGNALAVMTGNNQVNNFPGAANRPMANDVLRKEFGFKGIVMSDWANSMYWPEKQELVLPSGHSLLMSTNETFAKYIHQQVKDHPEKKPVIEKELETMIFYNLYAFFKAGIYDRTYRDPSLLSNFDAHKKTALKTAEESISLLKNEDHILPINPATVKKIVVLGSDEALKAYTGSGSGKVEGYDHIDYITGLKDIYGNKVVSGAEVNESEIRSADVVLYFMTRPSGEGIDIDFNLPDVQDTIERYSKWNKNLVVIHSGGNGFAIPWLPKVKGFVFAFLLGQQRGAALANVLSGRVTPSGKLPFTIEKDFNESPAKDFNKLSDGKYYWLGNRQASTNIQKKFGGLDIAYDEGIFIGYRWYEKKKIEPQFPFGFGLSYTSFSFTGIKTSAKKITREKPVTVSFAIKNTGTVPGAEVAQLYVRDVKSSVERPVKELKAFKKIFLQPGESKKLELQIGWQDLAFWDETNHQWKVEPGEFVIEIGSSSRDIHQKISITH